MTELWPDFWIFVQAAWKRTQHNWRYLIGLSILQSLIGFFSAALVATCVLYFLKYYNVTNGFDVPGQYLVTPIVIFGLSTLLLILAGIVTATFSILFTLILGHDSVIHLKRLAVRALRLLPLYLIQLALCTFIILGNLGLIVIPGIIMACLLWLSHLEYILHGVRWNKAMTNSLQIVSQNWRQLFLYSLPIGILYFIGSRIGKELIESSLMSWMPDLLLVTIRMVVRGVAMLIMSNYSYLLYVEARSRTLFSEKISIVLPVSTAFIGWLMIIFVVIIPRYESMKKSGTPFNLPFPTPVLSPSPAVRTK